MRLAKTNGNLYLFIRKYVYCFNLSKALKPINFKIHFYTKKEFHIFGKFSKLPLAHWSNDLVWLSHDIVFFYNIATIWLYIVKQQNRIIKRKASTRTRNKLFYQENVICQEPLLRTHKIAILNVIIRARSLMT